MNSDYLNESYQPLFYSWLWPLSRIFREAYNELGKSRREWKSKHRGSSAPDDRKLPGFDYDTLNGIVTFEKIWDIIKEYPSIHLSTLLIISEPDDHLEMRVSTYFANT